MRLPDLSRLAQAPTRGFATLDEWARAERREAPIGGNPSPPSDDEEEDDPPIVLPPGVTFDEENDVMKYSSALRRLYIGLHAGGDHDAEGFLLMAEKAAGRALLQVPPALWGKKITERYGNHVGYGEAARKKIEAYFKRDIGVMHYDLEVDRQCAWSSTYCDKAEGERKALVFKIMAGIPTFKEAPEVTKAVEEAMAHLVASYQQAVDSGVAPVVWFIKYDQEMKLPPTPAAKKLGLPPMPKPPPSKHTSIRALFDGSGKTDEQQRAFLASLEWMVWKVTAHWYQGDLSGAPSASDLAKRWNADKLGAEGFGRRVRQTVADDVLKREDAADFFDERVRVRCEQNAKQGFPCILEIEQKRELQLAIQTRLERLLQGVDDELVVQVAMMKLDELIDDYAAAMKRGDKPLVWQAAYARKIAQEVEKMPKKAATDDDAAEEGEAPAAALQLLPDPPPNPKDASVELGLKAPKLGEPWLGPGDTFAVRSDPRMAAGFALFCYKKSWDKSLAYAHRGVPVAQYLKAIGPLKDDQREARVPGLLAFLPLRMLRKLAVEYVQGPAQEISQVLPAHRADDYGIRPPAHFKPQLQEWAQSAYVQPRLAKLLEALPPDGLKVRPAFRNDPCTPSMELDPSKWSADALPAAEAVAMIRTLRTKSQQANLNVTGKGHVYPLYTCAWNVLQLASSETCYTGRASAQRLMRACMERMLAALDPLMSRVEDETMWRGVKPGRYAWVEAAGDDDDLWTARLIETLKATYFSVSTEQSVAVDRYFLGPGGILIEIQGPCRGVRTVDALKGPWACYEAEKEVLVAPHQSFTVLKPRLKNQKVNGTSNITTVTLRVAPVMPPAERIAYWKDDEPDPHWTFSGE